MRKWVRRAEVDAGARLGTTTEESEESAELKRLKGENAECDVPPAEMKNHYYAQTGGQQIAALSDQ